MFINNASSQAGGERPLQTLSDSLVTLTRELSGTAESFRALRTHIMAQHLNQGRRALTVCAATAGVGCTFVASNLAVALSQVGVKTLLVDVNLRQPRLDALFGGSDDSIGLNQCLSPGAGEFGVYIASDLLANLSVMFAGGKPRNPQELLANDRFAELMNFCLRDYDMTILDTPPANSCSDVHRVATVVGYGMIVTRRDKSLVNDVRTLIDELETDGAMIVGTVMTEV